MSAPTEPAFDWDQASSLLGEDPNVVDPEMAAIARELVDGAEVQFAELKTKNTDTDRKGISSLAHALRGCLLNFGFTEVGTILMDIEKGPPYTDAEFRRSWNRPTRPSSPPRSCWPSGTRRSGFPDRHGPILSGPAVTGDARVRLRIRVASGADRDPSCLPPRGIAVAGLSSRGRSRGAPPFF